MAVEEGPSRSLPIHRCRFVDWTPSPITALAFPPRPLPRPSQARLKSSDPRLTPGFLAVGHANGNVDLCDWSGSADTLQSPQAWVPRMTLPGPSGSKVDNLVFSLRHPHSLGPGELPTLDDLRLFSTSGGSELLEWDLHTGQIVNTLASQGGSIWSIAVNPSSTLLALGCEDGAVRLVDLRDGALEHHRRFDRVKSRLLSLAWGPPVSAPRPPRGDDASSDSDDDEEEEEWQDQFLVTGCSDSCLRKWDVATGRVLDRMTMDKARGEATLVWSVGVLADGVIVSGDSMGYVKFWDSQTATQLHSFPSHGADVLCLTIGSTGTTVYTSSVDQKIVEFSRVQVHTSSEVGSHTISRWVQTTSRRMHSHDVRALAMWPPHCAHLAAEKSLPDSTCCVLASGGLDMSVVLTPCAPPLPSSTQVANILATSKAATFADSYHRRMPYVGGGNMQLCRSERLLVCRRDAGVAMWRIPLLPDNGSVEGEGEKDLWEKVLEMELAARTNLTASAVSDDGSWLAISDLYEVKLFRLHHESSAVRPKRVKGFAATIQAQCPSDSPSFGASAIAFNPDSSRLILCLPMDALVVVIDLRDGDSFPVLASFTHHREVTGGDRLTAGGKRGMAFETGTRLADSNGAGSSSGGASRWISGLAVDPSGRWLATSDVSGRTHIADLESMEHACSLPSLGQSVRAMKFDPLRPALLLATRSNHVHAYNLADRKFDESTKEACSSMSSRLAQLHDPVMGMTSNVDADSDGPSKQSSTLLWSSTWIYRLNLDGVPAQSQFRDKKRRRHSYVPDPAPASSGTELETKYRAVALLDYIAPRELVVVERPLVEFLDELPPAYFRPKYGT